MHFEEGESISEAADVYSIPPHRIVKRIEESGKVPLCAHCRDPSGKENGQFTLTIARQGVYCSDACEKADQNGEIHCDECGFVCQTVGRYKSHMQTKHSSSEWMTYTNWDDARDLVLERDGFECVRCGVSQQQHYADHDSELHIHHIIKRRVFDEPTKANAAENLVTLCQPCHMTVEGLTPYELFTEGDAEGGSSTSIHPF